MNTWDAQEYHGKEIINLDVTRWLHVHKAWNTSIDAQKNILSTSEVAAKRAEWNMWIKSLLGWEGHRYNFWKETMNEWSVKPDIQIYV